MWNWQKIDGTKNLPKFDLPVVLYYEKDDKKYAFIGHLVSISGKGANWSSNSINIFDIFGLEIKEFTPTYWCEIETPTI
jgi:hypothetical protein